ncbi:MAG: glycosyltransferase family 2 protein [Candidatus Neomarinimicrobiota bacterium]
MINSKDEDDIDFYNHYESDYCRLLDSNYQKIHKGYMNIKFYQNDVTISLKDQYTFMRRMFKSVWVYYLFIIRILTFKNPIKEIRELLATRKVQMIKVYDKVVNYDSYFDFKSELISKSPLVSVILPTLNRYNYLKNALEDLEKQDYKNFEVIVIDQSDDFNKLFYKQFELRLSIIHQKEKGLWRARNRAIINSLGKYILFYEDDVRVQYDWITNHLKTLDFFKCDISVGVFYPEGRKIPVENNHFRMATQFSTGNAFVKKKIFKQVGLFDMQFEGMRMGDGEFGARCIKKGIFMVNNPHASCIDIKAPKGGLRELGSWDGYRSKNLFGPKPIPSVLYFYRKYWGNSFAVYSLVRLIPITLVPYSFKKYKVGYISSILIFIFFIPIILFRVFRSWSISTQMLIFGEQINYLE